MEFSCLYMSFRDNMGFCVIVYRKIENDSWRKGLFNGSFFLLGISDSLPLFLKMTVLLIFF